MSGTILPVDSKVPVVDNPFWVRAGLRSVDYVITVAFADSFHSYCHIHIRQVVGRVWCYHNTGNRDLYQFSLDQYDPCQIDHDHGHGHDHAHAHARERDLYPDPCPVLDPYQT